VFGARPCASLPLARRQRAGSRVPRVLTPKANGRPFPSDEQANDCSNWQTRFLGDRRAQTAAGYLQKFRSVRLHRRGGISPAAEGLNSESIVVRDPDGHAQIAQ